MGRPNMDAPASICRKAGMEMKRICFIAVWLLLLALPLGGAWATETDTASAQQSEGSATLIQAGALTGPRTIPSVVTLYSAEDDVWTQLETMLLEGMTARKEILDISSLQILYNEENKALLKETVSKVINDNPQFFYVDTCQYTYGTYFSYVSPKYNNALNTDEAVAAFAAAVQTALRRVDADMSNLEKALVLHDYLVETCAYNWAVATGQTDYPLKYTVPMARWSIGTQCVRAMHWPISIC